MGRSARRNQSNRTTMREITLKEYEPSEPTRLSAKELRSLQASGLSIRVAPTGDAEDECRLTPGSIVGASEIGDLSVLIRPKIGIPQLLSMACYAISKFKPQPELFDFPQEYALPDVMALALASAARQAFSRGLLHGYRVEEESLYTVRGRIMVAEQLRRRFGIPLPVEVRYDEFTNDILANRLVRAAVHRLGRMRLRSQPARRQLGRIAGMLENVSPVEFRPNAVPEIRFDRLNEHYRGVVSLSQLILRQGAYESSRGEVRAPGFVMDMNVVFQEFVTVALQEALGVSADAFGERPISTLDEGGKVRLRPDLVWSDGARDVFVGDAKYKNISGERVPNADLYQLLAYTTALDLPGGLLVYAEGEADTATYQVRHSGKRLEVAALDLSGTLDEVLARVEWLAGVVKAAAMRGGGLPPVNGRRVVAVTALP